MRIYYDGILEVKLNGADIKRILDGQSIREIGCRPNSGERFAVNIFPSEEKFVTYGDLAESFDRDSFQGFALQEPLRYVQLTFPRGRKKLFMITVLLLI